MLPASDIAEILTNLSALNLQPNITAAVLAAVLAPLLRSSDPAPPDLPRQCARRSPRSKPWRAAQRKRKKVRTRVAPQSAGEPADGPRRLARAALKANPGASLTAVAKIAGVSRSTVVNARRELGAEACKQARKQVSKSALKPETVERRARAQRFLKDALAAGPKRISDVEAAAEKAHVDPQTLEQARADLRIITSRANTGGAHAVQWSLPG